MEKSNKTHLKIMLAVALGFSFAAEATNYTSDKSKSMAEVVQNEAPSMQKELLGSYANIEALTASNMREAYITLLESVRAKHGNWSDEDWANAETVRNKLDSRKKALEDNLGVDDKAKIKVLQGEFRTLQTADDVKD
ncbi:hypothetical protein ACFSKU_10105 [Pontibacter silvestris]|uniref:Uncharacterized protein n=1 Tax=Pontibacter silvestris TaxID=2305183 RepID=A0ABW4WYG0_9BACT|nr:hypothetical protein [Pontibacter silvestris]MCC9136809.1 hypothetical protein [Pontibacter silvestris]